MLPVRPWCRPAWPPVFAYEQTLSLQAERQIQSELLQEEEWIAAKYPRDGVNLFGVETAITTNLVVVAVTSDTGSCTKVVYRHVAVTTSIFDNLYDSLREE